MTTADPTIRAWMFRLLPALICALIGTLPRLCSRPDTSLLKPNRTLPLDSTLALAR